MSAIQLKSNNAEALPLAVDLDGTLIRTDLFFEGILKLLFASPLRVFALAAWLLRGRAHAKARVAEFTTVDAAHLPYDERVVVWLRSERDRGRTIVLATATDRRMAESVSEHLGVFDAVFTSDGVTNLKSMRKAQRLAEAFPNGFVYAGNEAADIKVWRRAAGAVVVNASSGTLARASEKFAIERVFPRQRNPIGALARAVRPQQWAKNVLVFVPMMAGQGWMSFEAWTAAGIAFWALSLTASAVYLLNDAADIDADRRHPTKRNRPFAAGALSPALGMAAAMALAAAGIGLSVLANVLWLTLLYLAATTLYTFALKKIALTDVFVLAGLYTTRIVLGGVATGFPASDWLLAFSCFFFLSLALVKRVAETRDLAVRGGGALTRRGYTSDDTQILTSMGVVAGFMSALVLALYLQDDTNAARYLWPAFLWGLPAACLMLVARFWLKASRGEMHDDPIVFAAKDGWSWGIVTLGAMSLALAAGFAGAS
ncbi:MAG: UbiA family prenyltransferase [Hyphomonadaceae bacterium]|nr:UbiA family prenyltransferase [Hyphomonadaceae bacterium]